MLDPTTSLASSQFWQTFNNASVEAEFKREEWVALRGLRSGAVCALLAVTAAGALDSQRLEYAAQPSLVAPLAVSLALQMLLLGLVQAPMAWHVLAARVFSAAAGITLAASGLALNLHTRLSVQAAASCELPWLPTSQLALLPLLLVCLHAQWVASAASLATNGATFCSLVLAQSTGGGAGTAAAIVLLFVSAGVAVGAVRQYACAARIAFRTRVAARRKLLSATDAALAAHVQCGQATRLLDTLRRSACAVAEVSASGLIKWALPCAGEEGAGGVLRSWLAGVAEPDIGWLGEQLAELAHAGSARGAWPGGSGSGGGGAAFAAGGAGAGSAHAAVPALALLAPTLHRRARFRRSCEGGAGQVFSWAEVELFAVLRPPRLFAGATASDVAEQASVLVIERDISAGAAGDKVSGVVSAPP